MFMTWKQVFGTKMSDGDWGLQKAEIWAVTLQEKGWTQRRQKIAEYKARHLNWMPTTATDFYHLGVQDELPDCRNAYLQACNQEYDTAIAYETARRVGFYDLRNRSEKETYSRWQDEFLAVCDEFLAGSQFTLPKSQQIEFKPSKPVLSDEMESKLDSFFAKFNKEKVA